MQRTSLALLLLSAALLGACTTTSPDVIKREDAQRLASVQDATVLNVRAVTVDGTQSGIGGVAGGVVGGVAGSGVGGNRSSTIVGVLGAVAGAAVGNAIERSTTKEEAVEILVQLRNGDRRAIVQAKGNEAFNPGDAVLLITSGSKVRVMKAPPVQPAAGAAAP